MFTGRAVAFIVVGILFAALLAGPTAVFAADEVSLNQAATLLYQTEGVGDDGSGLVLGFLAAIIALIITVVAVVGAVGLGLIGIGYASTNNGDE